MKIYFIDDSVTDEIREIIFYKDNTIWAYSDNKSLEIYDIKEIDRIENDTI